MYCCIKPDISQMSAHLLQGLTMDLHISFSCPLSISPLPLFLLCQALWLPSFHLLQIKACIQPSITQVQSSAEQGDKEARAVMLICPSTPSNWLTGWITVSLPAMAVCCVGSVCYLVWFLFWLFGCRREARVGSLATCLPRDHWSVKTN